MAFQERLADLKPKVLELKFTLNARSRRINKALPSLVPDIYDNRIWQNRRELGVRRPDNDRYSISSSAQLSDPYVSLSNDPLAFAEPTTNGPDGTGPHWQGIGASPLGGIDQVVEPRLQRQTIKRRDSGRFVFTPNRISKRHSVPASKLMNWEAWDTTPKSNDYLVESAESRQHRISNFYDLQSTQKVAVGEGKLTGDTDSTTDSLSPTMLDRGTWDLLTSAEDVEMGNAYQAWQPRLAKIESVDSETLPDMDGFTSWLDDSIQDLEKQELSDNVSAYPSMEPHADASRLRHATSELRENFTAYDRQRSLEILEGMIRECLSSDDLHTQSKPEKTKRSAKPPPPLHERRKKTTPVSPIFPCTHCSRYNGEKAFRRKDHLDQHLRTAHHMAPEDLFPAFCPHACCEMGEVYRLGERAFRVSKDFTDHLRVVHEESLFNCIFPGCPRKGKRGYAGKANLINHQRKVHGSYIGDPTRNDCPLANMI